MAIHIDIIAHLRARQLMLEGEQLRRYANSLERDINEPLVRGAVGRNSKIIASNNRVLDSNQRMINSGDKVTDARNRQQSAIDALTASADRYIEIEGRLNRARSDASIERHTQALREEAETYQELEQQVEALGKARVRAEQEAATASRNEALARRLRREEIRKGQASDRDARVELQKLTSVQDQATVALQSFTTGLNLNATALNRDLAANKSVIDSTKAIRRGFETATDSVKDYLDQEKKLIDMMNNPGTKSSGLEAQLNRTSSAFLDLERSVRNARESVGEIDRITSVQDRAGVALASYTKNVNDNAAALSQQRSSNQRVIDSTKSLRRVFDSADESLVTYNQQAEKLVTMMNSGTASSSALQAQVNSTSRAYRNLDRSVREATDSLQAHLIEEAKSASQSPFGRGGRNFPDPGSFFARNLGALTPLGTVTPGILIPLGAGFFAVAQGAIAASQSLLLLPAALTAAGAGFGIMQMATMGVSDAFTSMMDFNNPDKFAESLRLLSPAAQQFVLSIQQLIPTFMELKNVVQDTFFAGMPQLINGLAQTYAGTFGNMAVGVSAAFNGIFMEIGRVLQDPKMQQTMGVMFDGIVNTFQALIPLVGSFTQVFLQFSSTGAQVLPTVIGDLANLTGRFSEFIDKAAASGDLTRWMTEGWEALKAFGSVVVYAGKMLYEVFGLHGPKDIDQFKATMFGLIDGFGVFLGALRKFFEGLVGIIREIANSPVGTVLGFMVDKMGGLESALALLAGGGLVAKLGWSFYKMFKFFGDGMAYALTKLGLLKAGMAALPAAGAAAGSAAGTATAAGLTGAGAAAGGGFAAKAAAAMKNFGWVGVGMAIATAISAGIRSGLEYGNGDPVSLLPSTADFDLDKRTTSEILLGPILGPALDRILGVKPPPGNSAPLLGGGVDELGSGKSPLQARSPFPEGYPAIPGYPAGGIPVPTPNPGGGSKPNIPYDQYSLEKIPLGQFGMAQQSLPDPRSLMSQLTPNQLSQKGYGYQVDPQGVFDAESALQQQRTNVEEARARVLELAQDNQATEQDKLKAQNNIIEAERSFLKSQVQLLEAQRGTWKKINETISDQTKLLEGLGAEIDADFGISRGLPGIAENITKFLANIVAAPLYGALAAQRAAGGDLGGGKGLVGAAALSGTFGPQFMQPAPSTPVAPAATVPGALIPGAAIPGATIPGATIPGAPLAAEAGFTGTPGSLNPNNVDTAGLRPQSMALLSHIQSLPQFKDIPLTSAVKNRENDRFPWHPDGRGLDFGVNAYAGAAQSALGDQLNKYLNDNKEMFGINHTLWKTMQGGDHFNHLHVGMNQGKSPLMENQALKGITPPLAGGATGITPSMTSGGIPIPLPVTIVGGMPAGAMPGITPPTGTPGATPAKPATPGTKAPAGASSVVPIPGAADLPVFSQPPSIAPPSMPDSPLPGTPSAPLSPGTAPGSAGRPAAPSTSKPGWTYLPNGKPLSAPTGTGDALFNDLADWYRSQDQEPPPAYRKYGTTPAAAAPAAAPAALPPNLSSPGQGMPMPWTLPPLAPAAGAPLTPGGYTPPGIGPSQIGAVVAPPEGTGSGFGGLSGGLLGAIQGAAGSAAGAAGMAGMAGGGGGGGAAAGAAIASLGAQIGIEELNRAIAFAGQAAGIGVSGLMETFLPTGGSELANNGWLPKILGGIVGMKPLLPNFANVSGAAEGVQQQQQAGNTPQATPGNVSVTQNNYAQNGNSATSDLERLTSNAAAAPMPAMGAGR
jgi:hypothetical protein